MNPTLLHRRTFLRQAGVGLGSAALGALWARDAAAGAALGLAGLPHHAPKAKRVIFLCMAGGPSHLESFDYKPQLEALDGQPMPASFTEGQPIAQLQGKELVARGPMTAFKPYGESGLMVSDFFPHTARLADELCVVKSMVTEQINHDPAHTFMNTGTAISGRPSMGAWVTYGLGSECDDLPGFVVLVSDAKARNPQPIASRQWSSGFLPAQYQGVPLNSEGDPVHYVSNPPGLSADGQRAVIDTVTRLDAHRNRAVADPAIDARISAYELAFRMQSAAPQLADLSDEPQHVLDLYGATPGDGSFASNCLTARRLAERGVRFIQLYHRGWDHHDGLLKHMTKCCQTSDQAVAALVTDLKQRGLLEDTLVIWGGEFGRTPMAQGAKGEPGRDHHIKGFTMWMAGGGVRSGVSYGATDELGYHAVEDRVHVRDLHATMLHLLGVDHERLTVKHQGLDLKLTGVEPARVVRELFA